MHRRRVLTAGTALLAAGLAGCTDALDRPRQPDRWADVEPRYPDDRTLPDDGSTHHLYVENFDGEPYPVTLTVVRADDETLVWRATYEAPDERGFAVPDLLVDGRTYEITLEIEDGERAVTEVAIEPCRTSAPTVTTGTPAPEPEGGGSRNVGVRIEDGAVSFHQDACDELRAGALPTGDHEYFIVDG